MTDKFNRPTVTAYIDSEEIDALIRHHYENIRALMNDMEYTFDCENFNDGEMIKIMRSLSDEIDLLKYYKGLKNENQS